MKPAYIAMSAISSHPPYPGKKRSAINMGSVTFILTIDKIETTMKLPMTGFMTRFFIELNIVKTWFFRRKAIVFLLYCEE
jgi:hypothetical protein